MGNCAGDRKGATIGTIGSHCVKAVDDREDPCPHRYLFALQPVRISGSIPVFMVRPYDGHHRIRERDALEYLRPHYGMDLHSIEFLGSEPARLVDDVFRHGQLSDVVQQGGSHEGFSFAVWQVHSRGDAGGIYTDAAKMIVGILVLGLNGQCKSLHGPQMQCSHVFRMLVAFRQPARITFADAVEKVCQG